MKNKNYKLLSLLFCFLIVISFTGCAEKKYGPKKQIDSQSKIVVIKQKPLIKKIWYNQDTKIHVDIMATEEYKTATKYKYINKECQTDMIARDPTVLAEAITTSIMILRPIGGYIHKHSTYNPTHCQNRQTWSNWQYSKPKSREVAYSGTVSFSINTQDFEIKPTKTQAKNGKADVLLVFHYPYISYDKAKDISQKELKKATVTVKAEASSKSTEISYCDITKYLNYLYSKYFFIASANQLNTLDDIKSYMETMNLPKIEKKYLFLFIKKRYQIKGN